jgi:hypothetical protein
MKKNWRERLEWAASPARGPVYVYLVDPNEREQTMKKSMSMQELREQQGREAPEPSTVAPDPIEPVELESFKGQDKPKKGKTKADDDGKGVSSW